MFESPMFDRLFFELVAFLAGLLIGSFLNVCIYRLPRDISVVRPRSHCPYCRRTIAWYDNIPVLSFLLLRARCRHCFAAIPPHYALVELSTGLAFLFSAYALGPTVSAAKYAIFSAILIALIVTDYLDRILPDELTLGGILIGLAFAPFVNSEPGILALIVWRRLSLPLIRLADAALAAAVCAGMVWAVAWAYQKVRHREGMGFGDVKMLAMIGAFLGLRGALPTMVFASIAGAVLGLGFIVIRKKDFTYELPFGSFLGIAALGVATWGEVLATWYGRIGQ
jgi:leader peptidase (prepilin peptidase)/N-methyltransferase